MFFRNLLIFLFYSPSLFAYFDPGSLSIVMQILVGIVAYISLFFSNVRYYILKIFNFILNIFRNKSKKEKN